MAPLRVPLVLAGPVASTDFVTVVCVLLYVLAGVIAVLACLDPRKLYGRIGGRPPPEPSELSNIAIRLTRLVLLGGVVPLLILYASFLQFAEDAEDKLSRLDIPEIETPETRPPEPQSPEIEIPGA